MHLSFEDISCNDFNVYNQYILGDKPELIPQKSLRKTYKPVKNYEIPGEILKLREKSTKDLIMFCKRYGDCGLEENKNKIKIDPEIDWIWTHAKTISFILTLSYYFQQKDVSGIRKTIVQNCDYEPGNHQIQFDAAIQFSVKRIAWSYSEDFVQLASIIISDIINQNISNVTRVARLNETNSNDRNYTFASLFDVAYWQILDTIEGGEIRKCDECDSPFIVTNKRQKFCPKLEFQSASNCALLFRQKRHLEKLEQKEK